MAHTARLGCFSIALVSLLLTGCAMTRAPEIHVQDATLTERTEKAQLIEFAVAVRNPTAARQESPAGGPGTVRLLEVHYTVQLDGRTVYHGRRDAGATLAAEGERTMILPAVVKRQAVEQRGHQPIEPKRNDEREIVFSGGPMAENPELITQNSALSSYRITGHIRYLPADRLSEVLSDLGLRFRRTSFTLEGRVEVSGETR